MKPPLHGPSSGSLRFAELPLCLLRLAALLLTSAAHLPASVETDLVSFYKQFVSSPPIIEELIFESQTEAVDGQKPMFAPQDGPEFYAVRWQPNGFRLLCARNPTNFTGASVIRGSGRAGNFFWSYRADDGLNLYTRTEDSLQYESSNGVIARHEADLSFASWILNLGIPDQEIGSIRWSGNRFRRTNALGYLWEGELVSDDNGLPAEVLLRVTDFAKSESYRHKVRLVYEPFAILPTYLRHYRVYGPKQGGPRLTDSFRIHTIRTSSIPLPEEAFLYSALNLPNTNTVLYSNNWRYVWVEGTLVPITLIPAKTRSEILLKRTVILTLMLMVILLPLLLRWLPRAKKVIPLSQPAHGALADSTKNPERKGHQA